MHDPIFWSVAIVIAVIVGLSKSGLLGGLGPMGVALLALIMSPRDAAGVLLPILIVLDVFAIWAYRRDFDLANLKILVPGVLIGIGVGWATSSFVSDDMVLLLVGIITTLFILDTMLPIRKKLVDKPPSKPWGVFWGSLAGFTSFVSHAGAPPYQVYILPQKLKPAIYAGTTAWLFGFINLVKLPPYYFLGQLSISNLTVSLLLTPFAILGVLAGIYLVRRISLGLFYKIAYSLVFVLGLYLIYRGASGLLGAA